MMKCLAWLAALAAGGTSVNDWVFPNEVCGVNPATATAGDIGAAFVVLAEWESSVDSDCQPTGLFGTATYRDGLVYAKSIELFQVNVMETYTLPGLDQTSPAPLPIGPATISIGVNRTNCGITKDSTSVMVSTLNGAPLDGKVPEEPDARAEIDSVEVKDGQFIVTILEDATFQVSLSDTITVSIPGAACTLTGPVTIQYWNKPYAPSTDAVLPAVLATSAAAFALTI